MDKTSHRRRTSALLYVLSSALSGNAPVSRLPSESIYSLAVKHSLGALCCHGLELAGAAPDSAVSEKLYAIRREMLFDNARAEILARFEREGIKYINLKGIVIKSMYPGIGMREMSDNDILVGYSDRHKVKKIMRELGYKVESYGKGHHDTYIKEPVLNFEMHVSLFSYKREVLSKYFSGIMDRAEPRGTCERVMSDEDFYLFLKAHEHKHYASGGTGLRAIVDTYVFLKNKAESLDFSLIERECAALGIAEYERESRNLSMKLLSPDFLDALLAHARDGADLPLTDSEWNMLDYISTSGTYGSVSNEIDNAMQEYDGEKKGFAAKMHFLFRRVFPPMAYYAENAPVVYRFKILIPFYCIGRLICAVFRNPARVIAQLKNLIKYKKK